MAHNYPDPGLNADETVEAARRAKAEAWALYAESGPSFDPSGDYLCGTCEMCSGTDQCLTVGATRRGQTRLRADVHHCQ